MKQAVWLLFLCLPAVSCAQEITEIFYDAPGSDAGKEWVELLVDKDLDLSDWRLSEGGVNHKLVLVKGSSVVPSGGVIVIADNAQTFLSDFPGFSGTLFDSSFSLSNTSEVIAVRNADLIDQTQVTYSSSWGAEGDGNSLQKVMGIWVATTPTPGEVLSVLPPIKNTTPKPVSTKKTQNNQPVALGVIESVVEPTMSETIETPIRLTAASSESASNNPTWFLAITCIAVFAGGAVVWVRRANQKKESSSELSAEDFEITDITDK